MGRNLHFMGIYAFFAVVILEIQTSGIYVAILFVVIITGGCSKNFKVHIKCLKTAWIVLTSKNVY